MQPIPSQEEEQERPSSPSTRRLSFPSPSAISSSDAGEREEVKAGKLGEEYWETLGGVDERQAVELQGDASLAFREASIELQPIPSPVPSLSPSRSPSRRPFSTSPRLRRPSFSLSPRPFTRTSSPPEQPNEDDDDDDDGELSIQVIQRRPSLPPSRSPSPSPEPQQPQHPQGRSFRNRTAAQLNPYSIEQAKYTRTLLRNGWQGAVVAGPRKGEEESAEALRRRKEAAGLVEKDDLGGWLEFEEGRVRVGMGEGRATSEGAPSEEEEGSVDGEDLLEREARRRDRMGREVDAALGGEGRKRARRVEGDSASDLELPSHLPIVRRIPGGHKSKRPRPPGSNRGYASDGARRQPPSKGKGKRPTGRADSEPPSSSPATTPRAERHLGKRKTAAPSKSIHARQHQSYGREALDAHLLAIAGPSSSSPPPVDSDVSMDDHDEPLEAEVEDEEVIAERQRTRMNLAGKRKKALGLMMPAVFMKKAQADLRLMEREKREGVNSGSDMGSGDEVAVASDDSEGRQRHRARKRKVPRLLDQPLVLDGEAFTDESSDDGRATPVESSEEEGDAVSSWLHNFAPRRQKVTEEDIVDRFLKRSRGKSQSVASASRKRPITTGQGRAREKQQDGRRPQLHEKQNTIHSTHARETGGGKDRGAASLKPKQSRNSAPTKIIPLDTDLALFQQLGRVQNHSASHPHCNPPPQLPPLPRASPDPVDRSDDHEQWASFGKFSHDFEIERLPFGVQFPAHSFVKRGHLFSLLNPPPSPAPTRSSNPFGISLRSTATPEDIEAALPLVCDAIFDHLAQTMDVLDLSESGDGAYGEALRFVGAYVSEILPTCTEAERTHFATATCPQLERLDTRLDSLKPGETSARSFNNHRLTIAWYLVDIVTRLASVCGAIDGSRVSRQAAILIRRLVDHGVEHTTKSLKAVSSGGDESIERMVDDPSVEAWLGLVSLAISTVGAEVGLQEVDLWRLVEEATVASLPAHAVKGPIAGEVISYTAMMLCAISQFTPSGLSTSSPRLGAHWPTAARALEPILPAALSRSDHSLSNTAIARRDRYLWTLFARCLVFVTRWGWKLDVAAGAGRGREELLPKLFDLLNARRLADLTIEAGGDLPPFLQDLEQFEGGGSLALDKKHDTAFSIFLKLVIHAAHHLPPTLADADRRRQLTRLFLRLAPIHSGPWTRRSPELLGSDSTLMNHYSLHMTFAMLCPSSAAQRLDQARRLVQFAEVDEEARRTVIRAALYFARVFRWQGLRVTPVVEWLVGIAGQLKSEYGEVEKVWRREERAKGGVGATGAGKGKKDKLWQRVVLLTMVLRSVQLLLRWSREGETTTAYPDVALLHPAWTSQLLDSPLALDPMIGSEVVKTIGCFLDVRRLALPQRQRVEEAAGHSQDDFGMFDIDFEDPALDAMLGVEEAAVVVPPRDEHKVKEKEFAELIKKEISPAFFRLVSNILVPDHSTERGGGPTVWDRSAYAQQVVECWTRCLTVMVENDVADWAPYLRYGDHSWKRISDPSGRRDIGLLLAIQILAHDPTVFPLFRDEFLEIWFQSIVARRLTAQHKLTEGLLNLERTTPLLEGVPFGRDEEKGGYRIEVEEVEGRRVEALGATFRTAARLLAPSDALLGVGVGGGMAKGALLNLLRGMLASMRDNLAAIADEPSRREYAMFCRGVLAKLREAGAGGAWDEQSLPDMRTLGVATAG